MSKAAAAEIFANKAEAQLAKGRRKPVTTNVSRYVGKKSPAVARALRKVLKAHAKTIAAKASKLYAKEFDKLRKDTGAAARVQAIIDEIDSEDLGVDLQGELEGPMLAAFKKAAAVGATQVGIEFSGITDQVDEAAVAFADTRGGELIKDLAGTTDDAMRSLLARAVDEGMSADDLSTAIEDLGAFSDYRADLIATTELAFAHVQGNVEGWKASEQVEGKRWVLADTHPEADECDDAADAGVVALDDDFVDGIDYPPAHPGCVVSGTVVAPGGRIAAQFTRRFEGQVVSIRTARHNLTVTPNHPVLTQRGWVAAGALQLADHVFECVDSRSASAAVDPHEHNVPARIEQVAAALLMAGGVASRRMPTTSEAFHGDGMPDGEVDVVWAAGALPLDRQTDGLKFRVQRSLGLGHPAWAPLLGERAAAALCESCSAAAGGGVGGGGDLGNVLRGALGIEDVLHLAERADLQALALEGVAQRGAVAADVVGEIDGGLPGHVSGVDSGDLSVVEPATQRVDVARAAQSDAALLQDALDYLVGHSQLTREAADRLTGLVAPAEIRHLSRGQFDGHVHNLSTANGWYFANAIITHNCLCDVVPVLKDDSTQGE